MEEWYYDSNKLEQFYNFQEKYFAEIANKIWTTYDPDDYNGCYMSTAMEIDEQTMDILKHSFEQNINPNDEYDRRRKLELINEKVESINEEFGIVHTPTITWKDKLRWSVNAYEAQEDEIFSCIFEHYCEQKKKNKI